MLGMVSQTAAGVYVTSPANDGIQRVALEMTIVHHASFQPAVALLACFCGPSFW